jgi:solute carrier family 45 protein 1/2/4
MTGFATSIAELDQAQHVDGARWAGSAGVRGPKWAKLPLLTVGGLGMQVLWSVEMGYGELFITTFHHRGTYSHVVYVSLPVPHISRPLEIINVVSLCGGPVIRAYNAASCWCVCFSSHMRARIHLSAYSLRCVLRPMHFTIWSTAPLFSWWHLGVCSRAVAPWLYKRSGLNIWPSRRACKWLVVMSLRRPKHANVLQRERLTIWLAVFSICFIDFSVNAVMACSRAILVDTLPKSEQELGNAWAGRMSGLGSIAGFFMSVKMLYPLSARIDILTTDLVATSNFRVYSHSWAKPSFKCCLSFPLCFYLSRMALRRTL